jgi:hypothetical protein
MHRLHPILYIISFLLVLSLQVYSQETRELSSNTTGIKKQILSNNKSDTTILVNEVINSNIEITANNNSETYFFDYNKMPQDVQLKMNDNKAIGISLFTGISKAFRVQIKSCTNDSETQKFISLIALKEWYINYQWVSEGTINIYVQPTFDIDFFDDFMAQKGIEYNFLNEYYFLK